MRYILTSIFLLWATVAHAQEPQNIHLLKEKIISYHKSGEYYRDINKTINDAKTCLETCIKDTNIKNKKNAIILDIDDTSLHLLNYNNKLAFGINQKELESIVMKADALPIMPTLNLYNFAKSHGIAVFFISGRFEAWRELTIKNLKKAGYKDWDGLYLRSDPTLYKTNYSFKSIIRKLIRSQGYNIIANIGDQESDLADDSVSCKFKLPNPHYFTR